MSLWPRLATLLICDCSYVDDTEVMETSPTSSGSCQSRQCIWQQWRPV